MESAVTLLCSHSLLEWFKSLHFIAISATHTHTHTIVYYNAIQYKFVCLSLSLTHSFTHSHTQKKTDVLPPAPSSGRQGDSPAVPPLMRPPQPWQVTRRHAAVSACERRQAQRRRGAGGGAAQGPRSEPRHAAQQHTIALQRKLLREQQEQILLLQKERCLLEARGAPEQRWAPGAEVRGYPRVDGGDEPLNIFAK